PDRLERPPLDLAAQGIEQLFARLGDPAADHHDFGIEDVHEAGDRGAEQRRGVPHHLERIGVTVVGRLVDDLRGQLREVAFDVLRQGRLHARLNALDGALGDRRPGSIRFDAAVVAAFAAASIRVDRDMTELAGGIARTAIDVTVDDDPTTDAGAQGQANDVIRPAGGPSPPLAVNRAVRVVVQRSRQVEAFADPVAQRHVGPAEIRGKQHDAGLRVQRPGRADADAFDLFPWFLDRCFRELDDAADYRIGA